MKPKFLQHKIKEIREGPPRLATQQQMAEALGIKQSTYYRKEAGQYPITVDELILIANRFGVDITQFFDKTLVATVEKGGGSKSEELMDRLAFYQKMVDQLQKELDRCQEKLTKYEDNESPFHKSPPRNGGG